MFYDPTILATKINDLLKIKNMSQKIMLESCQLNKNTISSMLSRKSFIKSDSLAKIADYLSCSVDYLLGRTDTPEIVKTDISPTVVNSKKENELLMMFRELDYAEKDDIFDILKLKYEKHLKKTKERLSLSNEGASIA